MKIQYPEERDYSHGFASCAHVTLSLVTTQEEVLKEKIYQMLAKGFIRPSVSNYSFFYLFFWILNGLTTIARLSTTGFWIVKFTLCQFPYLISTPLPICFWEHVFSRSWPLQRVSPDTAQVNVTQVYHFRYPMEPLRVLSSSFRNCHEFSLVCWIAFLAILILNICIIF